MDQLPAELLAEVLYWCIALTVADYQQAPTTHPRPYSWLVVRHVCSKWRHVALTFPTLSTFICLTRPECVQDLLSRSGTLPLHVYDPFGKSPDSDLQPKLCRLILANIERIASADLALVHRLVEPKPLPELFRTGISPVRSLHLQFWAHPGGWQRPDAPLFPNIDFPHLEQLSCECGHFAVLKRMLLPTLRRLELLNPTNISCKALLTALDSLQALEELSLTGACNGFKGEVRRSDTPAIVLPHLRELFIEQTHADDGVVLLLRIHYPAATHVALHFSATSYPSPGRYTALFHALETKMCAPGALGPAPVARALALISDADLRVHIALWAAPHPLDALASPQTCTGAARPFLALSLPCAAQGPRWAARLLRRLPLRAVTAACVAERVVHDVSLCAPGALGAMLPALAALRVEYEAGDAADVPAGAAEEDALGPGAFAALRVLQVRELRHAHLVQPLGRASALGALDLALAARTPAVRVEYSWRDFHADLGPGACGRCAPPTGRVRYPNVLVASEAPLSLVGWYAFRVGRVLGLGVGSGSS